MTPRPSNALSMDCSLSSFRSPIGRKASICVSLSLSLRSIRSPRSVCGFSKNRSDIWLASRINEGKRSTLLFLSSRFFHFSSLSVLFSTLKFLGEKRETEDNCRNSGTVHFERITVDSQTRRKEKERRESNSSSVFRLSNPLAKKEK